MMTTTLTTTGRLSSEAQRRYDNILGPIRDRVVAGEVTAIEWQVARANMMAYLSMEMGSDMWAS